MQKQNKKWRRTLLNFYKSAEVNKYIHHFTCQIRTFLFSIVYVITKKLAFAIICPQKITYSLFN